MADLLVGDEGDNATSSHIYLIDENGNYIFNPNPELVGQPVENEELLEMLEHVHTEHAEHTEHKSTDEHQDMINFVDNNQGMIGSYSLVPNTQWVLVHAAVVDEFEQPVRVLSIFLGAISILVY